MSKTFSLSQQSNFTTRAYLRVSTPDQSTEKNKIEILQLANEKKLGNIQFFEEICSGKIPWRERAIGQIIEISQKNDVLIVPELSRLSRTMLGVMEILSIALEKGIRIYSVKGSWELNNSLQSKMIAFCFSLAAEVERELISSRTREALHAKKLQGIKLGRPRGVGRSKIDPYQPEIIALLNNGSTLQFISQRYNTTPLNLSLWMKKHNIQKPKGDDKHV